MIADRTNVKNCNLFDSYGAELIKNWYIVAKLAFAALRRHFLSLMFDNDGDANPPRYFNSGRTLPTTVSSLRKA